MNKSKHPLPGGLHVQLGVELREQLNQRLALIYVASGVRERQSDLVKRLVRAWLLMPFEPNPDAIEDARQGGVT